MSAVRNEIKINALLQQMEQQTGYAAYKAKIEAEQKKREEFSPYLKNLAQLEQQDPLRVSPMANENTRKEREKEELRHRERQNIMMRVQNRQYMREQNQRTYG